MNKEYQEEVKKEGRRFAYLVIGVLLFLLALSAIAQNTGQKWETFTFPDGQGVLSISNQPCSVPVVIEEWERIRMNLKVRFNTELGEVKQSRLLWHGKVYAGCYAIGPDNGYVYNIDSTGEKLVPIPREMFVPHESALPASGLIGV